MNLIQLNIRHFIRFSTVVCLAAFVVSCSQNSKEENEAKDSLQEAETTTQPEKDPIAGTPLSPSVPKASVIKYKAALAGGLAETLVIGSDFKYSISKTNDGKGSVIKSKGFYNKQLAFSGDPDATLFTLTDSKTSKQRFFIQQKDNEAELIELDNNKKLPNPAIAYKALKK